MPKFSIIIVNYNGGKYLQKAIDSIALQSFRDFETILFDNNSEDGSIESLDTSQLASYRLMAEDENHGFARANNIAARNALGSWIVLLNPDAVADRDWLQRISDGIDRHPEISVFASAQLSMDQPELIDGAGDAYLLFGLPWRGGFERPIEELPKEGRCFSPCGASAVYRREVFLSYGGFDERFFCYCEDVDLGYRMQLGGEDCVFLPDAIIQHKGSGVSGRGSYFTMFHGNRNRTWSYLKNTPLMMLVLTLPGHLAIIGYMYFRNRPSLDNHGMRDGILVGFRTGWKLRRQSEFKVRRRKRSVLSLISIMGWNPFSMIQHRTQVRPLLPKTFKQSAT